MAPPSRPPPPRHDRGRTRRPPPRRGDRTRPDAPAGATVLYGWHPVTEALRNPDRQPLRLLATPNAEARLRAAFAPLPIEPEIVRAGDISRLLEPDAVHQGLYLEAGSLNGTTFDTLEPDGFGDDALLLALDQITDPHNVGAIVRTAAAFGVRAILTTARHSPAATGVLAKAASGGLEHVPFVVVRNLGDALTELGTRGFRRVGLDSQGGTVLGAVPVGGPAILVLGAEGKGLRARTRACCDVVARLDMPGAIKSLNVSNAAAVALYALATRPSGTAVSASAG